MDDLDMVNDLLEYRPDKVKEILLRFCKEQSIRNEMLASLITARRGQYPVRDSSNGADMTSAILHHAQYPDARQSEPSRAQQKPASRLPSTTRQYSLLSPPRTASSVTSHSVKDDEIAGEDVLLLLVTEQGFVNRQVVRMRTAPIGHSLIGEDFVIERELQSSLVEVNEFRLSVPRGADFGDHENVRVSLSISLTWRRPTSNSSHATKFYVVPKDTIDTDLLFGSVRSGPGAPDNVQHVTPLGQRRQGVIMDGLAPNLPPYMPALSSPSYHASRLHDDSSTVTTTQQRHSSHHPGPHHHPQFTSSEQRSGHAPEISHIPVPNLDHNNVPRKLRLSIMWEATQINVWLDMAGPGEAFFKALQKEIGKRKNIIDRTMMSIVLRNVKDIPDNMDLERWLALDEDSLDADWDAIREWLEENKRDKTPHIYGRIEVGEG